MWYLARVIVNRLCVKPCQDTRKLKINGTNTLQNKRKGLCTRNDREIKLTAIKHRTIHTYIELFHKAIDILPTSVIIDLSEQILQHSPYSVRLQTSSC